MKEFNISLNPRNDEVKRWIELMFPSKSINKFLGSLSGSTDQ